MSAKSFAAFVRYGLAREKRTVKTFRRPFTPHFHLCRWCGAKVRCEWAIYCPGARKVRAPEPCDRCKRPRWYRWLDRLERAR